MNSGSFKSISVFIDFTPDPAVPRMLAPVFGGDLQARIGNGSRHPQ